MSTLRGAGTTAPGSLVTCSAAEAVHYRASGRSPGWAPGWTLPGDFARGVARGRVSDHGDESTFVSSSLAHNESKLDAVAPVSPEKTPGFPGWASPGGSHHFFATLPPARSQLVTDTCDAMRPLHGFKQRQKMLQVEARQPSLSPLRGGDGFGRRSRGSDSCDQGGRARQVRAGVLGTAEVPDFEQRVSARPSPHASSTAKGLNWSNCWCEVDDSGKMRLCATSGSAFRILNLRRTLLDVVKGSIHAVLEEDSKESPVIPDKYKNEAFFLPRDGQPRLNLPPASKISATKSPVFLKFAHETEMADWIDTLLDQGVVPGPGVQDRAQRRMRLLPPTAAWRHASDQRKDDRAKSNRDGRARSKSVEAVDPTVFEESFPANLKVVERERVMYDCHGTAPISRRTWNILPLNSSEREMLEWPLQSPEQARSPSRAQGQAWRRSGVSAASLNFPSPQLTGNEVTAASIGQDLIRMHALAVEVRKGQKYVSTPPLFLSPGNGRCCSIC